MSCCTPFDQGVTTSEEYIYPFTGNGFDRSPDVKAIVAVGNNELGVVINNLASLNAGFYSDKCCDWLDWLALGIYGFERPTIAIEEIVPSDGGFGRFGFGRRGFGYGTVASQPRFARISDDIFKRLLQWHLYRGDGYQFCISWLKHRIARFIDREPSAVSVVLSSWQFTITIPVCVESTYFKYLLAADKLVVPGQYTYIVNIV